MYETPPTKPRMCVIRLHSNMFFVLFVATSLSAPMYICADPILLIQITDNEVTNRSNALAGPVSFGFRAYLEGVFPTPVYFSWFDEYDPGDVGMTFLAPPAVVAGASTAIRIPAASYETSMALVTSKQFKIDNSFCNSRECFEVFVPFTDVPAHTVVSVERIIDKFVMSDPNQGQFHSINATQRIRIWAEPIPPVPGDFNRNGTVDAADYTLWRDLENKPVTLPNESGLNPGSVDIEDYWFWKANFGASTSMSTTLSLIPIPEPSTKSIAVAAIALVITAMKSERHRQCTRDYCRHPNHLDQS